MLNFFDFVSYYLFIFLKYVTLKYVTLKKTLKKKKRNLILDLMFMPGLDDDTSRLFSIGSDRMLVSLI